MAGIYSTYHTVKTFILSVLQIAFAGFEAWLAWFIGSYGIGAWDWDRWLSYGCFVIAALLAIHAVCNFFEALPGLSAGGPQGGSGNMRLATRDDLRKGGLFGRH